MKNTSLALASLVCVLAGCSGGGSSSGGGSMPQPVQPPPVSSTLATTTIDGVATFVTSKSLPVYTFSADGNNSSVCTAECLALWPAVSAPSGALSAGFASFKRSDTGQMQLSYNGQPLYTFVTDSADTATGVGQVVPDNGTSGPSGTFELVVASTSATPAPTSMPTTAPYAVHH